MRVRKILVFTLIFVFMVNCFSGCKSNRRTVIYKPNSSLVIVASKETGPGLIESFASRLESIRGISSKINTESDAESRFEIVIGKTDRAVSVKAYEELAKVEKINNEYVRYAFYCDNNKFAIAYEADSFEKDFAINYAINKFFSSYATSSTLELDVGLVESGTINIVEEQRKKDNSKREKEWQKLLNKLTESQGENNAQRIVAALKEMYKCYDSNVIYWLANLYDKGAGFYYSNSGRDTEGFGSDLESTNQAIQMMEALGVFSEYSGSAFTKGALPEEMTDSIGKWVKNLQNSNGYFYHPQWMEYCTKDGSGKIVADTISISRKSRDLGHATNLLNKTGYKPTYNTPNGVDGDGIVVENTNVASSNVEYAMVSNAAKTNITDYLANVENFQAYLDSLDIYAKGTGGKSDNYQSYVVTNTLSSLADQIKARDMELDEIGKPLQTTLLNWLDEKRDPTTGLWIKPGNSLDYDAINSAFKTIYIYKGLGVACPNPEKVINACVTMLNKPLVASDYQAVVYVYNMWVCIKQTMDNVNKFGSQSEKNMIKDVKNNLLSNAATYITKTTQIVKLFMKPDGSSSYIQDQTSATSQGMPVAIYDRETGKAPNEGDVNASTINTQGVLSGLCTALGITEIMPFGEAERIQFILAVERLDPIQKKFPKPSN